jgi:hypothetical protein
LILFHNYPFPSHPRFVGGIPTKFLKAFARMSRFKAHDGSYRYWKIKPIFAHQFIKIVTPIFLLYLNYIWFLMCQFVML